MSEYKKPEVSYKSFKYSKPETGEEVVISGFSGRFPESNNVEELKYNLFNRKDCISYDYCRWRLGISYKYNIYIIQRSKVANIKVLLLLSFR